MEKDNGKRHHGQDRPYGRAEEDPADRDMQLEQPRMEKSLLQDEATHPDRGHADIGQQHHGEHGDHDGNGGMHAGHEQMFRRRFVVSLFLSIPVLLYSETLQAWLGFSAPVFLGSEFLSPIFAVIIFLYGGVPFLQMAIPELRAREPGMMTLISMAISVAFVYSVASLVLPGATEFFWELVTLIDVMLLGHWIEMRSIRRADLGLPSVKESIPVTQPHSTD